MTWFSEAEFNPNHVAQHKGLAKVYCMAHIISQGTLSPTGIPGNALKAWWLKDKACLLVKHRLAGVRQGRAETEPRPSDTEKIPRIFFPS